MNRSDHVLLVADASPSVGLGHIMRCLALGQGWRQAGGTATLVTPWLPTLLKARFSHAQLDVVESSLDESRLAAVIARLHPEWAVLDVGGPGAEIGGVLHSLGCRLMLVDDLGGSGPWKAHIVLNQNLYADPSLYPRASAELLLGTRYVLLRDEYLALTPPPKPRRQVRRILVSFGGTDPGRHTLSITRAIVALSFEEVMVVVSSSHPDLSDLKGSGATVYVDVSNMADLMLRADVAVSAGGTTVWELAYFGVPSLIGSASDQEQRAAESLRAAGLFTVIGDLEGLHPDDLVSKLLALVDRPDLRRAMHVRAKRIVDGRGRLRVMAAMKRQGV